MNSSTTAKELNIYPSTEFRGTIVLKGVDGRPYLISLDDKIIFLIIDPDNKQIVVKLELSPNDEFMGEYPFIIPSYTTLMLNGNYEYCAFIHFSDGAKYQIVPNTRFKAGVPKGTISYGKDENIIIGQVPRFMIRRDFKSIPHELISYMIHADCDDIDSPVLIEEYTDAELVLVTNSFDSNSMTPAELVECINSTIESAGAENAYVSGFYYADEIEGQGVYRTALITAFGDKYIDVESILKTPVYLIGYDSQTIISSTAFKILQRAPKREDIVKIANYEYPDLIMESETHFNIKGYCAAAEVIAQKIIVTRGDENEPA